MNCGKQYPESGKAAALCLNSLTVRQRQIMDLVLAGECGKNIAIDLGISRRTVENHRATIMERTGSKSIPALVRQAVKSSMKYSGRLSIETGRLLDWKSFQSTHQIKEKTMKMIVIAAAAFAITSPAIAQQGEMPPMDHSKMDHSKMSAPGQQQSPAMDRSKMPMDHRNMPLTQSDMMAMMNDPANPYGASEMDMHKKMMMAKADQPSELWTRKMIEHHRGAIAMSRIALEKAADKQTRNMAQMTINAQTGEIAKMQAWLKSHGKSVQ